MKRKRIPINNRNAPLVKKQANDSIIQLVSRLFFHPIFFAIFSASFVGILFGFTTLSLVEKEIMPSFSNHEPLTSDVKTENKNTNQTEHKQRELHFYTIQAGVFEQNENAADLVKQLDSHGVSSVIWQREGKYYVLIDTFSSEKEARKILEQLQNKDVEAFVKQWPLTLIVPSNSNEEMKWLDDFITVWKSSVEQIDLGEHVDTSAWLSLQKRLDDASLFSERNEQLLDIVTIENELSRIDLLTIISKMERMFS